VQARTGLVLEAGTRGNESRPRTDPRDRRVGAQRAGV